jgi:hypothetical protein
MSLNAMMNDTLITMRIKRAVVRMQTLTFYLGDSGVHQRLAWHNTPDGNVLVVNDNIRSSRRTASSSSYVDEGGMSPATLSAIVYLSEEDFCLSSDGYWTEPTKSAPSITDIVLTCTGAAGDNNSLVPNFHHVVENIKVIIQKSQHKSHVVASPLMRSAIMLETKIKFSHRLFEVSIRICTYRRPISLSFHVS